MGVIQMMIGNMICVAEKQQCYPTGQIKEQ